MTFKGKISKGHNSVKNVGGVTVLFFSAHCQIMAHICTKFHEIFSTVFKLQSGHDFHTKNFERA